MPFLVLVSGLDNSPKLTKRSKIYIVFLIYFFSLGIALVAISFTNGFQLSPKGDPTRHRERRKNKENNIISSRKVYPNRFSAVEQHNIWWNEILYFDIVYVRENSNTLLLTVQSQAKAVATAVTAAIVSREEDEKHNDVVFIFRFSFGFPPFYSPVHVVCVCAKIPISLPFT